VSSVRDKWSVEYEPSLDDIEIHSFEQWDRDQSVDMPVYHRRRTAGLWTALAHDAELMWLSGRVSSFSAVRDHANRLEATVREWNVRQESLKAQVHKMDAGWKSGFNDFRLRAAALEANANQREHNDLNQRTAALNAQIADISSSQHTEQARIAQLERELTSARQELASAKASYTRELAALRQQQASSQREIVSLNNVLSTDQINFEAEKNHDAEIVPGVLLHLTSTDIARQRYGGWIWLTQSRRRIWIRRQVIESPQVFYPVAGDEAYELVVTQVNTKDVAGYLLVPSSTSSQQQDVAVNSGSVAKSGRGTF
jgi:hypothetical protein